MSDGKSRFTSDRRSPDTASWEGDADWTAGIAENVEVVGRDLVGRVPSSVDVAPDSGLYHYSFTGGSLADNWGNGPELENNGATLVSNGKGGEAFRFTGGAVSRLDSTGPAPELEGIQAVTAAAWIKPRTTRQPQDYPFLFDFASQATGPSSSRDSQQVAMSFEGYSTQLRFHSPIGRPASSNGIPDGEYTLVTGVFDGYAGEARLYYNDAQEQGVVTGSGSTGSEFNHMRVGDSVSTSNDDTFDGRIDWLKFYSKALSESEIRSLYSTGSI